MVGPGLELSFSEAWAEEFAGTPDCQSLPRVLSVSFPSTSLSLVASLEEVLTRIMSPRARIIQKDLDSLQTKSSQLCQAGPAGALISILPPCGK